MEKMSDMMDMFRQYENRGIYLSFGEEKWSSYQAAEACLLREDNPYMMDYVMNEKGELLQIRFDRINI
ncbi:hypothetical protein [Anaerobium acetethylicum]|uniref:Uncharacterized protein n=1 Tax=Anaerobium acetethylicum TaxID=1619234 RepID=A0A1D3TRH8_9FIRM|nr:hypothetical protein [Anaerobium acetethylicum]SCP96328.1 hypothetical protein SAMN05421730_1004104 [Anaerobium acetethylicum]